MEYRENISDRECLLYGTRACAVLNMPSCKECPLGGRQADEQLIKDVALFESLLPEGGSGASRLFESETCCLCKGEKGSKDGYAVFDMVHTEPKALHQKGFLAKILKKGASGFMIPLQFACCKRCRRRSLLVSYLPMLLPAVLLAICLIFAVQPKAMRALREVAQWLPLALAVAAGAGGYILGRILSMVLRRKYAEEQYLDLREHPYVKAMQNQGWRPLFAEKQGNPVFTKKRMEYGLGTAPGSVYEREYNTHPAENSEEAEKAD